MLGREPFIVRVAEDAMAPRVRMGDYVWIDPDEPAADGCLVAVRDPGCGGETVVRLLVQRGMRCSRFPFMRSAGTVHVAPSRSISSQVALRTSPERAAVSTRNSNANFDDSLTRVPARTFTIQFATSSYGSVGICRRFNPLRGSAVLIITLAGSFVRWPWAAAQRQIAEMRCFTRRAVSRFSLQIGLRTAMTWPGVISDTGSAPRLG